MRIDKNEVLAGQSILKVRELMKRGSWYPWNESLVVEVFKVNSPDANEFLQALLEQGYIESFLESRGEIKYINTIKGNALGMASAAKPMSRKNAEKKLDDFLERVREVNSSPDYCYHINKVLLFGSMLSGEKEVNDIDLAVELVNGKDLDRRSKARVNIALREGRRFNNIVAQVYWPREEVLRFLKARSRIFSIHEMDDQILDKVDSKVIYQML